MEGLFPPQDVSSLAELQEATATSKLLNEAHNQHGSTDTSEDGGIENIPNRAPPAPHHGVHELMGETLTGWAGGTSTNANDHRHL